MHLALGAMVRLSVLEAGLRPCDLLLLPESTLQDDLRARLGRFYIPGILDRQDRGVYTPEIEVSTFPPKEKPCFFLSTSESSAQREQQW